MSLVWIVITSVVLGAVPKVVWRPGQKVRRWSSSPPLMDAPTMRL